VCRVIVNLNDRPKSVSGSVSATNAIEYVVKGRPGDQFSMELLAFNDPTCFSFDPLQLLMTTQAGTFVDSAAFRGCGPYGPWTVPADGVLLVRVDAPAVSTYTVRFGRVEFEDVATRLRSGSATFTGGITVALDGIDHVVRGRPGDRMVIQNNRSFCGDTVLGIQVLDSTERILDANLFGDCDVRGTWAVPADGIVKVRVVHAAELLTPHPDRARYNLTVRLFRDQVVTLPPAQETIEVTGSIDMPLASTEYVITDPAGVDALWIERLAASPGAECVEDSTTVMLWLEFILDGSPITRQELVCGSNNSLPYPAGFWDSGLSFRVIGSSFDGSRPSTGPYRLVIHPLRTKQVPVDVTDGPAAVTSSLDLQSDIDEYTVTGEPGRLLVAYDPAPYASGGACHYEGPGLTVSSNDAGYDPAAGQLSQACGRYGPWRIPDNGTLHLQVGSVGGFRPSAGPYRLTFDTIEYETVPLDLSAGPQLVSARIEVPLDGTDYVVTGEPGEQVQVEVLSLDDPASCDTTQVFPLQLDVYDTNWFLVARQDVGYNGCYLYPPYQIGSDGKLVFRTYLGGSGEGTSGGYTIRFSRSA